MFAEASLFSEHYHCDAVAEMESDIQVYPKAEITSRLRAKPEALWQFARELAGRLQGMRTRFEIKQIRSAQMVQDDPVVVVDDEVLLAAQLS